MNWTPGLYTAQQIPESAYHRDDVGSDVPTLSRGIATRIVNESLKAARWWHPKLGGHSTETTRDQELGNALHTALLGSGQETVLISGFADFKKDAAKTARDRAREEGKIPLLDKDLDKLMELGCILKPQLAEIIPVGAQTEVTALWEEPIYARCQACNGAGFTVPEDADGDETLSCEACKGEGQVVIELVRCKTRIDVLAVPSVFDLKRVKVAGENFERSSERFGYDIQAYLHLHVVGLFYPELAGRGMFTDVLLETEPPYDVATVEASVAFLELGRHRWERALVLWSDALTSGKWPGRGKRIATPTNWQMTRELEYELAEGDGDGD